jgi:hypothetical protein
MATKKSNHQLAKEAAEEARRLRQEQQDERRQAHEAEKAAREVHRVKMQGLLDRSRGEADAEKNPAQRFLKAKRLDAHRLVTGIAESFPSDEMEGQLQHLIDNSTGVRKQAFIDALTELES